MRTLYKAPLEKVEKTRKLLVDCGLFTENEVKNAKCSNCSNCFVDNQNLVCKANEELFNVNEQHLCLDWIK